MIVIDVKQGSVEWQRARMGMPTASQFHRILTPKTRKTASGAKSYLCELLAERLLGHPINGGTTDFMLRGSALEAHAVSGYAFTHDVEPKEVGFCLADGRRYGASPDRLVGEYGGLDIKCLAAHNHVSALLGYDDDAYDMQAHGCMLVTGRQWWDVVYSNPDLPARERRVECDFELLKTLSDAVETFCDALDEAERMVRQRYGMAGESAGVTQDALKELSDEFPADAIRGM